MSIGEKIGDYEILRPLGKGGMGQVFQVKNLISGRIEAMKVLLPELLNESDAADRFLQEIRVLASLNHPNIAALHTAQRFGNHFVMIMEFVDGITLEAKCSQRSLSLEEGLYCFSQVLLALGYAHRQAVVHRDIKPANIMITPGGEIKVMDFGIAKVTGGPALTKSRTTVGSAFYMSPEQIECRSLDGRSDLYSAGVVLYELVTGRRPFEADNDYAILSAHVGSPPVPPIELAPGLPADLNRAILTALAKHPDQRFQTAEDFLDALKPLNAALGRSDKASIPFQQKSKGVDALRQIDSPVDLPLPGPVARPSHRSLYMILGSLAAVAALVIIGFIPKSPKVTADNSSHLQSPPSAEQRTEPSAPGPPTAIVTPSPISSSNETPPPGPSDQASSSARGAGHSNAGVRKVGTSTADSSSRQAASGPTIAGRENPQPPLDLTVKMVELQSRAKAVNDNWEGMRAQLKGVGADLRQNISESLYRMNSYREKSEAALRSGDYQLAKHLMDLLEKEIKLLEAEGK